MDAGSSCGRWRRIHWFICARPLEIHSTGDPRNSSLAFSADAKQWTSWMSVKSSNTKFVKSSRFWGWGGGWGLWDKTLHVLVAVDWGSSPECGQHEAAFAWDSRWRLEAKATDGLLKAERQRSAPPCQSAWKLIETKKKESRRKRASCAIPAFLSRHFHCKVPQVHVGNRAIKRAADFLNSNQSLCFSPPPPPNT